jgi:hypothetical protein
MPRSLLSALGSGAVLALAVACGSFAGSEAPTSTDAAPPPRADGGPTDDAATADAADGAVQPGVPTELAQGLDDLAGVALTSTTVYLVEHAKGRVLSVPIAGGAQTTIDSSAGSPLAVAVANDTLYWADYGGGRLRRVPLAGGSILSARPTPGKNPFLITPASDRIVVVALGVGDVGEVQQYQFDFLAGPSVGNLANPFDAAVYSGKIYWTESAPGRIGSGSIGAGDSADFVLGETDCQSIAADGSGVYWTRRSAGLVRRNLPIGTVSLAAQEVRPHSLVTDGAAIYWLSGDGKVRRLAKAGSAQATTIAEGYALDFAQMRTRALAVNDGFIVWITTDGRVLRLAK